MISDNERREVAARLRALPIDTYAANVELKKDGIFIDESLSDEVDYSQIHDVVLGCFPAEHMHPGDYEELHERLADLIDRPTTTRHGKFKTKYGRETPCCEVCGYSIGDMRWNYCPKCGAEVVE